MTMMTPRETIQQWSADIQRHAGDLIASLERLQTYVQVQYPDMARLLILARSNVEMARASAVTAVNTPPRSPAVARTPTNDVGWVQ